jgi:hypothetical protein
VGEEEIGDLSHGAHESHHVGDVVAGEQLRSQGAVFFEEEMEIGAGVVSASEASALRIDRLQEGGVLGSLQTNGTLRHKSDTKSRCPCWVHTIEPVSDLEMERGRGGGGTLTCQLREQHTPRDPRGTPPPSRIEVCSLGGEQRTDRRRSRPSPRDNRRRRGWDYMSDNPPEASFVFPASQPPNGIAREISCDHCFQANISESSLRDIQASLNDPKEILFVRSLVRSDATIQPSNGSGCGFFEAFHVLRDAAHHVIQLHHNIRTDLILSNLCQGGRGMEG